MSIQVIDRLSHLLDVIARYDEAVTLKILSAETGLHTSTTYRILASLIDNGLVEREGDGYHLGPKLVALGRSAAGQVDLVETAKPIMAALRDQIGESVNLTVREADEVVYVGRQLPKRMIRVEQIIGARAPLHVTAVGKLMLGVAGEEAIRVYAERNGLCRYTENTITDVDKLVEHCSRAAIEGVALDDEEAELDVGCIGVLLTDERNRPIAGLSISAPLQRRQSSWATLLKTARDQLAERMGCVH